MYIQWDPEVFGGLVHDYVEANRGLLIGSLYMAAILDAAFITITSIMTFKYFSRVRLRMTEELFTVGACYILGLGSTILGLVYGYNTFVTNFSGNFFVFFQTKYDPIFLFFMPFQIALVQFHLARKAFLLCGRNYWVLAWLTFIIAGSVAAALNLFVAVKAVGNAVLELGPGIKYSEVVWLALGALADISITVTIVYNLLRRKSQFKDTRRLVTRLIWLTAETQLIPPVLAVATFIQQIAVNNTYTRFVLFFIGGKLYLISLLFSIQSRENLNGSASTVHTSSRSRTFGSSADQKHDITSEMPLSEVDLIESQPDRIRIRVETEISRDHDRV